MNYKTIKVLRTLVTLGLVGYGVWLFIRFANNKVTPAVDQNTYTVGEIDAYKQQCKQSLSIKDRYPEITNAYCECYVEEVIKKYSKRQLQDIGIKPASERDSILNDIIMSCAKGTGRDTVK